MLPGSGCMAWLLRCMVKSPDRKGDDHGTAAARDVGPGRPRRAGPPLPDDPAARRGPSGPRSRPADPLQPRYGPPGAQALPGWGPDAVPHRPHLGQPPHDPPAWEQELVRVADCDPHEVGVDSARGAVGCWPTTWPG